MNSLYSLVFSMLLTGISSFLDLDELQSINYGIDILDKPLVFGSESPPGSVLVSSKYGQQYQCSYQDKVGEEKREKEDEKLALETGIPELLKPMESGPCLVHTSGWWTYEFCYGKQIRQYHTEDGKISGNVLEIGHYESEFDWNNTTEKSKKSRLNRYHTQQYVNGTKCDLSNKPRRAEVRFLCEEGSGDYIARVDEPESCSYIITVRTMKICHHPYLKPPSRNRPVPITCNPLLTQEDFDDYTKAEEEKAKKRKQAVTEVDWDWVKKTVGDDIIIPDAEADDTVTPGNEETKLHKLVSDSLVKNLQEKFGGEDADVSDLGVKVIKSTDDIKELLREALEEKFISKKSRANALTADQLVEYEEKLRSVKMEIAEAEVAMNTFPNNGAVQEKFSRNKARAEQALAILEERHARLSKHLRSLRDVEPKTNPVEDEEEVEEEVEDDSDEGFGDEEFTEEELGEIEEKDSELMKEFEEGLDEITAKNKGVKLAKYKDTIESAIQAQFGDLVNEAQTELSKEGEPVDVDKQEAFEKLTQTLTKLLKRLKQTENDIKTIDEELAKTEGNELPNLATDTETPQTGTPQTEALDKESPQSDAPKKESQDDTQEEGQNLVFEDEQGEMEQETSSDKTESENKENHFDIRADDVKGQTNVQTDNKKEEALTLGDRVKVRVRQIKKGDAIPPEDKARTLQLPDSQKEKLESSVKAELEKAGMETGGRKIEVKIITAGYYDNDDGSLYTLSEEESQSFNKMIVAVLGQNDEEIKEIEKQDKLESNYGFIYGKNKKSDKTKYGYS